MFEEILPYGSQRQRESGALIFPVHPKQREAERNREDLARELAEVRKLKEELMELKKELRGD